MNVYRYYCRFRPPMPGAIPTNGLTNIVCYDYREPVENVEAWGYAEYMRPLTEQEIYSYELYPSKENPTE